MNKDEIEANQIHFLKIQLEAARLRYDKFAKYGKCYDVFGVRGIIMRIIEKSSRLKSLVTQHNLHSKIRSDLLDVANYAIMGVMIFDGEVDTILNESYHDIKARVRKLKSFDELFLKFHQDTFLNGVQNVSKK